MPSLTSCYFCGDAVGASLDEYDVPPDAPADEQVTVTLCAGCNGKLTELLGELGSAGGAVAGPDADADSQRTAGADPAPDFEADPRPDVSPATDAAASSDAESTDTESTANAGSESDASAETPLDAPIGDSSESDLDPVVGEREPIFADDDGALLDEDLPVDPETDPGPFTAEKSTDSEATDGTRSPEQSSADPGAEADPASATRTDREDADGSPSAPDTETSSVEASTGGPDGATQDGGQSNRSAQEQRDADGPLADVSPRTYNRVVRLLQNREFPVDRADFEALATSAYELDHGECTAALDGAIEKGLLVERDGSLHRPE